MNRSQRIGLVGSCLLALACGPGGEGDGDDEDGEVLDAGGQDAGTAHTGFEGWFGTFHAEDRLDVDLPGLLGTATNLTFSDDGTLVADSTQCDVGELSEPIETTYHWEILEPGRAAIRARDGATPFDFLGTMVDEATIRVGDDCNQLLIDSVPVDIGPGTIPWHRGEICFGKCEECPAPCGDDGNAFPVLVRYEYCEEPSNTCAD